MRTFIKILNNTYKLHKNTYKYFPRIVSTYPMVTNLFILNTNSKYVVLKNHKFLSNNLEPEQFSVDTLTFENVCEETLQSLADYFEEIIESDSTIRDADVSYSSGVLTVDFGKAFGTYVINRQSPNRQIWFSSPTSGPKRFDYIPDKKYWLYKHTGDNLHKLLQKEISKILKVNLHFNSCVYSGS